MFLIGRRCLNEIFVMILVQYVKFVSGAANICKVSAASNWCHMSNRGNGEVSE